MPDRLRSGRSLNPIKYSEFLKSRIANSKMEIIEGTAHMPMLENPKAMTSILSEFLKTLSQHPVHE